MSHNKGINRLIKLIGKQDIKIIHLREENLSLRSKLNTARNEIKLHDLKMADKQRVIESLKAELLKCLDDNDQEK